MKGPRPRRDLNILAMSSILCLFGLVLLVCNVVSIEAAAQDYTATSLLDEKQAELNTFVGVIEANARNCDALKTCSSNTSCSRLACYEYGTQGDANYKCLGVLSNPVCGTDCNQRNFDYTKSFIRRADSFNPNIAQTVCTQRTLDDQFRRSSIGDSTYLFRVFYGSMDGTTRLYPGLDESCETDYDPRIRPWFKESIYVPKVVTILIDCGRSMRDKLIGATNDQETYISKEINAALAVLNTLREDSDYVNIQCFDRDGIKPPGAKSQRYSSLLYQSFSDNLTQIANGGITENPSLINTTDAIKTAISELTNDASPAPPDYLKVILMFTSGEQYQNLSELNIPGNSSVNVFVYNFLKTGQTAECNPTIRASSEEISVQRYDNPLLFLESFYSFLAKIHQSVMKTNIDFGEQYADYSGVDNSTLTLSKAAFGPNGELLGVVGIDFFQKKVDQQFPNIRFQDIVIAARNHPTFKFDPNALTTTVCFNHTETCPGIQTDVPGFLCGTKTGNDNIGCCGSCTSKNTHRLAKILGGVFGSLAVLVIVFGLCWRWDMKRNRSF
ncbi:hypothetical protein KC19_4G146100 [Ceratodon purpureus]|uniref:VWFA domain-containing protein n=1 Tax=Ceratodon purpureus TaxID=3225 RepID=A0A8T0IB96_CERPU|nr:hypothetical protein KC19_4G146100 [Ceratodon purpureus]